MIRPRWIKAEGLPLTIMPPSEPCANAVMARSISPPSRTSTGRSSTPSDGATAWIAADAMEGSRKTATRVTPGAISLSMLQSFPAHRIFVDCKTGDVTARPCQALNITSTNRIDDSRKHYRNGGAFHFVCVQLPSYRFLSLVRCSEMKLLFVEKCPCSDRPRPAMFIGTDRSSSVIIKV